MNMCENNVIKEEYLPGTRDGWVSKIISLVPVPTKVELTSSSKRLCLYPAAWSAFEALIT